MSIIYLLKTTNICYPTVSVGQDLGRSVARWSGSGSLMRIKLLARVAITWGWRIHFQVHSCGVCRPLSPFMRLSTVSLSVLVSRHLASPSLKEGEAQRERDSTDRRNTGNSIVEATVYFITWEQYTITSAVLSHTADSGTMEEGPTQHCEYL